MKKRKKKARPEPRWMIAALCVAVVLASGCRREAAEGRSSSGPSARPVRIATFEPKALDPTLLADGNGRKLAENLFEGLTARDAKGDVVPGLASAWTTSPDGLTWTFVLRQGLVWSDGAALTAADVVFSFRRAVDPSAGSPNAGMFDVLAGAAEITAGRAPPTSLGVAAGHDGSVVLTLARPEPDLARRLATGWLAPVPAHAIAAHGARWTEPANIVVSGPYRLDAYTPAQGAVLVKNPSYHSATEVAVERVEYRFTSDVTLGWQWFQLGEVDLVEGLVPPEVTTQLMAQRDPSLRLSPFDGVFFLFANTAHGPLADARVRRALDLAIDRQRLVRHVLGSGERAAWFGLPARLLTGADANPRARDLPRARAMLAEAGFTKERPLKLSLSFNTNQKNSRLAEALERDLAEGLGIELTLENTEWSTFLSRLDAGDYQLAQLNMGGYDALDFLSLFETGSPTPNRSRWSDTRYDAAVAAYRRAPTLAGRAAALKSAMAIYAEQLPALALFEPSRQNLVRVGLRGFEPTPDDVHPARHLSWTP